MWLLFYLFFHVSTGWARMPKPCFIAQIYCFLKCCTKSFGYKYLLNYINIYKLLTHKYIPDTHIHVICIVWYLKEAYPVSFCGKTGILAPQALRDNEPIRVLIPPFFARRSESLRFRTFFAERQGFEPWVPVRAQRFSRPPRSTTPASFRISHAVARVVLWVQRY